MSPFTKSLFVGLVSLLMLPGCSGADEAIECCMLRRLADQCTSRMPSASLQESARNWRNVGESSDNDACIAMVDGSDLGCSSTYFSYDEDDAIVYCAD